MTKIDTYHLHISSKASLCKAQGSLCDSKHTDVAIL